MKLFLLILALSSCSLIVRAQTGDRAALHDSAAQDSTHRAYLTVMSDTRPLRIYLDTAFLGLTPLISLPVPVGQHLLRAVPGDPILWQYVPVTETLQCVEGRLITQHVRFRRFAFINSQPYGALVRDDTNIIGQTPLELPLADSLRCLTLSKPGFQDLVSCVSADTLLTLSPVRGIFTGVESPFLSQNSSKDFLPVYLMAAAAVIAGAGSAYFKIKADNISMDYTNTGNTADLSRIHHYDTLAGVSLVICQVNLLGLAYFLFTR